MPFAIDQPFVSRLLLGALSEHEQRMLVVRLLLADSGFRLAVVAAVQPFRMFDLDLTAAYEAALEAGASPAVVRGHLLTQAYARGPGMEALLGDFTLGNLFEMGEVTSMLFSWTMAEFLIERGQTVGNPYYAQTSLYLATMVIDVVEILGASGHSPRYPRVVGDLRLRLQDVRESLRLRQRADDAADGDT